VTPESLKASTAAIATTQGVLRETHLKYHLSTVAILTPGQMQRYAELRGSRLHDTRHTTGQRGLRATGNLKFVQTLLRHSEIRTTATFYTDTTMADLRAGMERTESQKKSQTRSEELTNTMKNKA
jgi:integrase